MESSSTDAFRAEGEQLEPVHLERAGPLGVVTLNRPKAGNAIDVALADRLLALALELDADASIRCVVLTGSGRMFCTGGDVKAIGAAADAPRLVKRLTLSLHAAQARLLRMNKPLVVAVNGAAAGAGLGLAIMGDVVLAVPSAAFSTAYDALGLTPDGGATWMLPRLVGLRQAQRMALEGVSVAAPEAERIGLVTRVVQDAELLAEARTLGERLAAKSMPSIGRTRDLLMSSFQTGLETQLEREAQAIAAASGSADGREGLAAFLERRRPEFQA